MKRTLRLTLLASLLLAMSVPVLAQVTTRTVIFEDPNPRTSISHYILSVGTTAGGPYPTTVRIDMPQPPPPDGQDVTIGDVEIPLGPGTYYAVIRAVNWEDLPSVDSAESPAWTVYGVPITIINLRITIPPPE